MLSPEDREIIKTWLKTSITIREPKSKAALARKLGCSTQTIDNIKKEGDGISANHSDLDELPTEEKIKIFDRLLFQLVQDPKTPSKDRELFAKRYGLLVDKSETKVKLGVDADELFRIRNEAARELGREGFVLQGNREVCPEPPLLPEKIRENQG